MSKRGKTKGKGANKDEDGEEKDALAFKFLSADHSKELLGMDVVQMQNKLREIFSLDQNSVDLTQAAILDYYTSAVYWGVQQSFTAQQLSGFFTIIHIILDNIKEKHMSLVENSIELKKLFVGLGCDDIRSQGLDFFSIAQANQINDYIFTTFFQHYRLFLYMFTHKQAEEIIGTDLSIEVARPPEVPFPPPLDEGVTEEMYQNFVVTPPASPSPESKDKEVDRVELNSRGSSRGAKRTKEKGAPVKGKSSAKSRASSRTSSRGASKKKAVPEDERPDAGKELEDQVSQSDIFADLTAQDVREVIESVTREMLGGLQTEVAKKLQEKEGQIIQRINKIHKVAE